MNNFNYQFFEEFTKLNKVCVAVYQVEGGTFGYLVQMGGVSGASAEMIPRWYEDLEQLHRYRMVYQALAQSTEAFEEVLCSEEDVNWLRAFGNRIMERTDPLALLHQRGYCAEDEVKHRLEAERAGEIVVKAVDSRERYINGPLMATLILIAVGLTCLICTVILNRL